MRTSLIALSMALMLPVLALAQTEVPADPPATQGAAGGDGPAGGGLEDQLSLGTPANAEPQLGDTYIQEKNGDWEMRCVRTEAETDPCQMYQLMTDSGDNPVAEISIFRLPEGSRAVAGATVIVPLETALQQQLTISVDGGQARRYPFAFCNPVGCYARIGLVQEEIDLFRRGAAATVTIVPALAIDQQVDLTLSLSGFTASFDKTSVIEQQ